MTADEEGPGKVSDSEQKPPSKSPSTSGSVPTSDDVSLQDSDSLANGRNSYRASDVPIIVCIILAVAAVFWYDRSVKEQRAQRNLRETYRTHMTDAIRRFYLITGELPQSASQVVSSQSFRTEEVRKNVRELQGENYATDEKMLIAMEERAFADATPIDDKTLSEWKQQEQQIVARITGVESEIERLQLAINPEVEMITILRMISFLSRNGIADQRLDAYLGSALKVRPLLEAEVSGQELRESLISGVYSSAKISTPLKESLKEFHTRTGLLLQDMQSLARQHRQLLQQQQKSQEKPVTP